MARSSAALSPLIGWPLLSTPDADGRLNYPDVVQSVAERLKVILLTRPGERLAHQYFGTGLQDFVHQPNTLLTRRRIHDAIRIQVTQHEPRIHLDQVLVEPDIKDPAHIHIALLYRLRRTGQYQRTDLVLQFGE